MAMTDRERLIRLEAENRHLRARLQRISQLEDHTNATRHMPQLYIQAFCAITNIAHYGIRHNNEASTSHTGKLQSRAPIHHPTAYRTMQTEQKHLGRRAGLLERLAECYHEGRCPRCSRKEHTGPCHPAVAKPSDDVHLAAA
jgi:hypothetical protein